MVKRWVMVSVVVVVVMAGRFAVADTESDRNSLLREIEGKVKDIASKLSGFDGQRDGGNADYAQSYANEVKSLANKLRDVKESDSKANDISSNYPGYVDSFNEAVRYLKEVKRVQFLADGVASRCVNDEADLQTLIRYYVGRPDEADEATTKLPAKGQEYGRTYAPMIDTLRDANNALNSAASSARFEISVSSNDPWSDVRSNYRAAASQIVAYWKDRYGPVDAACKRLALGEKHPDIERSLSDLKGYTGNVKQTVTQLKKDYNVWLADARKVREMTKQDHAELREVMCRKGVDEEDIAKKAAEVADRWSSQISSAYGTLLGQSDRLTDRASSDKLKKYKGSREVLDGLRANRATLEKIKYSDLQGSNNPRLKAKMQYGTQYHKNWSCSGIKEFEISSSYCSNPIRSGSGCAADCVVTSSTCEIIELKPDNDEAKAMGNRQKDAYEAALQNWFAKNKDELLKKYPSVGACVKDGQITTKSRLELYSYCPSESDAKAFGEDLDGISSDVSESE